MDIKRRKRAAYHEAGHIVALYLLTGNIDRIESVHVTPDSDNTGGLCMHTYKYDREINYMYASGEAPIFETKEGLKYIQNEICYTVAGGISQMLAETEEILPIYSMQEDINYVYSTTFLSEHKIPSYIDEKGIECSEELDKLFESSANYIKKLFHAPQNWKLIENIASELMISDVIPQWEIYRLLGNEELSNISKSQLDTNKA